RAILSFFTYSSYFTKPSPSRSTLFPYTTLFRSNITDNKTVLSHPLLDGNPDAKILITYNWHENAVYNNHPTGVMYDGSNWVVFNEDLSPMPEGAAFNVYVINNKAATFVHNADVGNIFDDMTIINHPLLNNNPYAMIYITKNHKGTYNTSPIGAWYTG